MQVFSPEEQQQHYVPPGMQFPGHGAPGAALGGRDCSVPTGFVILMAQ